MATKTRHDLLMEQMRAKFEGKNKKTDLQTEQELEYEKQRENAEWYDRALATAGDIFIDKITTGVAKGLESFVDAHAMVAGQIGSWFGADDKWASDFIKEDYVGQFKDENMKGWNDYMQNSYVYDASDDFQQVVHGSLHSIGNMLPAIAANFIPYAGPFISKAMFTASAMGAGTEEALKQGEDFDTASLYGVLEGGKELATEMIGGKLFDSKFAGVIGNTTNKVGKVGARSLVKEIAKQSFGEGAEEAIGDLFEPIIQKVTIAKDESLADLYADSLRQMPMDFISGALTGALMNGGTQVVNIAQYGTDGVKANMVIQDAHSVVNEIVELEAKRAEIGEQEFNKQYKELQDKLTKLADEYDTYMNKIIEKNGFVSKKVARQVNQANYINDVRDASSQDLAIRDSIEKYNNLNKKKIGYQAVHKDDFNTLLEESTGQSFKDDAGETNAFITAEGNIIVNKDSQAYKSGKLYNVIGHEFLHTIEKTEGYKTLYDNYVNGLSEAERNAIIDKYRKLYQKPNGPQLMDEYLLQEAFADYVGENITVNYNEFARMLGANSKLSKIKEKLFGYKGVLSEDNRRIQEDVRKGLKSKNTGVETTRTSKSIEISENYNASKDFTVYVEGYDYKIRGISWYEKKSNRLLELEEQLNDEEITENQHYQRSSKIEEDIEDAVYQLDDVLDKLESVDIEEIEKGEYYSEEDIPSSEQIEKLLNYAQKVQEFIDESSTVDIDLTQYLDEESNIYKLYEFLENKKSGEQRLKEELKRSKKKVVKPEVENKIVKKNLQPTVQKAYDKIDDYEKKYGPHSSFEELEYEMHLTKPEMAMLVELAYQNGKIDEGYKESLRSYLKIDNLDAFSEYLKDYELRFDGEKPKGVEEKVEEKIEDETNEPQPKNESNEKEDTEDILKKYANLTKSKYPKPDLKNKIKVAELGTNIQTAYRQIEEYIEKYGEENFHLELQKNHLLTDEEMSMLSYVSWQNGKISEEIKNNWIERLKLEKIDPIEVYVDYYSKNHNGQKPEGIILEEKKKRTYEEETSNKIKVLSEKERNNITNEINDSFKELLVTHGYDETTITGDLGHLFDDNDIADASKSLKRIYKSYDAKMPKLDKNGNPVLDKNNNPIQQSVETHSLMYFNKHIDNVQYATVEIMVNTIDNIVFNAESFIDKLTNEKYINTAIKETNYSDLKNRLDILKRIGNIITNFANNFSKNKTKIFKGIEVNGTTKQRKLSNNPYFKDSRKELAVNCTKAIESIIDGVSGINDKIAEIDKAIDSVIQKAKEQGKEIIKEESKYGKRLVRGLGSDSRTKTKGNENAIVSEQINENVQNEKPVNNTTIDERGKKKQPIENSNRTTNERKPKPKPSSNSGYDWDTNKFSSLQVLSKRRFNAKNWKNRSDAYDGDVLRRVRETLRNEIRNRGYSDSSNNGILEVSSEKGSFKLYKNVDGQTFHDIFEIARNFTENGELVDLHNVKSDDNGVGYDETFNFLSEDGMCGFVITKDGDLISVFNANRTGGFLRAIAPFVKENAKTLDCFISSEQNLQAIYEKIFGFKTSSVLDHNMDFDHDEIAKNHNKPKVAFMVNTNSNIEERHFNKEDWDGAKNYQVSFLENNEVIQEQQTLEETQTENNETIEETPTESTPEETLVNETGKEKKVITKVKTIIIQNTRKKSVADNAKTLEYGANLYNKKVYSIKGDANEIRKKVSSELKSKYNINFRTDGEGYDALNHNILIALNTIESIDNNERAERIVNEFVKHIPNAELVVKKDIKKIVLEAIENGGKTSIIERLRIETEAKNEKTILELQKTIDDYYNKLVEQIDLTNTYKALAKELDAEYRALLKESKVDKKKLAKLEARIDKLNAEIDRLNTTMKDKNAENRKALAELKQEISKKNAELAKKERELSKEKRAKERAQRKKTTAMTASSGQRVIDSSFFRVIESFDFSSILEDGQTIEKPEFDDSFYTKVAMALSNHQIDRAVTLFTEKVAEYTVVDKNGNKTKLNQNTEVWEEFKQDVKSAFTEFFDNADKTTLQKLKDEMKLEHAIFKGTISLISTTNAIKNKLKKKNGVGKYLNKLAINFTNKISRPSMTSLRNGTYREAIGEAYTELTTEVGGKKLIDRFGEKFDENILEKMKKIKDGADNMSLEEIEDLVAIARYISAYLSKASGSEIIEFGGKSKTIKEWSKESIEQQKKNSGKKRRRTWHVWLSWLRPDVVFKYMDNFDENGINTYFYNRLLDGETREQETYIELFRIMSDYYQTDDGKKIKKMLNKVVTINDVTATVGEFMSIYKLLSREDSRKHIASSGFSISNEKGELTQYHFNKEKLDEFETALKKHFDLDNKNSIYSKYIDKTIEYFERAKELKIETDINVKGYTNVIDDEYFPIKVVAHDRLTSLGENMDFMSASMQGAREYSFNSSVEGLKGMLEISSVDNVFQVYTTQMARYVGYAKTINDINSVFNYTLTESDISADDNLYAGESMRNVMASIFGAKKGVSNVTNYYNTLLKDVQGIKLNDDTWFEKLRAKFATFQLGANVKVMANQLSALPLSLKYLKLKYFLSAHQELIKLGLDIKLEDMPKSAQYRIMNKSLISAYTLNQKIAEKANIFNKGMEFTDELVVKSIWKGCLLQCDNNKTEATKLFDKIMRETQSFNTLQRSGLLRSENSLIKSMMMFTVQSSHNLSNVAEWVLHKASGKKMSKADVRKYHGALIGFAMEGAIYTAIGMLFKWLLGKDDDEEYDIFSILEAYFNDNILGMIPFLNNVEIDFDMSSGKLINTNEFSVGAIGQLYDAFNELQNFADPDANWQYRLKSFITAFGMATGIPTRNLSNYSNAVLKICGVDSAYEWEIQSSGKSIYNKEAINDALKKNQSKKAWNYYKAYTDRIVTMDEDTTRKIFDLYKDGYTDSYIKQIPSTINGVDEVLTTDREKFSATYSNVGSTLKKTTSHPAFTSLSDMKKQKIIKKIVDTHYDIAYKEQSGEELTTMEKLVKNGYNPTKTFIWLSEISEITGTYKVSRKEAVQKYINRLPIMGSEKYLLYMLAGYKVPENKIRSVRMFLIGKGFTYKDLKQIFG